MSSQVTNPLSIHAGQVSVVSMVNVEIASIFVSVTVPVFACIVQLLYVPFGRAHPLVCSSVIVYDPTGDHTGGVVATVALQSPLKVRVLSTTFVVKV